MKIKNLYPIVLVTILIACKGGNRALSQYDGFLATLDTLHVESATVAAKKYKLFFKNEDVKIRDEGFVLFTNYYERLEASLNTLHERDSIDYEPLYMIDSNGKELPAPKRLKQYNDKLKSNGFQIGFTEGYSYIQENRDFISKWFYGFVSSTMKKYLEQLNKENKEGFQDDAALIIEPKQYVNRLVWWDKFIGENPEFVLTDKAKDRRKYLLTFFLIGMDNTPTLTDSNVLDEYYKTAYVYLQNNYPKSETNKIVNPYFKAVQQGDIKRAANILVDYRKKGIIISFEGYR